MKTLNTLHKNAGIIALLILALFMSGGTQNSEKSVSSERAVTAPVQIEQGTITGVFAKSNSKIRVYKGIPYAAPPVGRLRWHPPQPAESWAGVKAMDEYGDTCIRPSKRENERKTMSEDCLNLNIWTPAKDENERLPVMLWIHGGGFTGGSGRLHSGVPLSERGIVLVSINYRLGPLGFFAHPLLSQKSESNISGNYGILDMIFALQWIQNNIAQFGGDPDNVTIFGESAGGTAVYILCSSELTKGLFHKAIAESPWVTDGSISPLSSPAYTRESVEATGERITDSLFDDSEVTLEKLYQLDAAELVEKTKQGFRLPAAIDGYVLKENPASLFSKGLQQSRPFLAGTNTDEGTMFSWGAGKKTVDEYRADFENKYIDFADDILAIYSVVSKDQVKKAVIQSITDVWFAQPTRWMVRNMSEINKDAYLYHFAHQSMGWPAGGSSHAAEMPFVFGTLDSNKHTSSFKKLSKAMITYWTQFAKTGNPNDEGTPNWPRYEQATDLNIRLDTDITVEAHYLVKNLDVIDSYYSKLGSYK
jgi:para-nitrobenzyl esterase